jgi:hypothetical protein
MKKMLSLLAAISMMHWGAALAVAGEHGGTEHHEHGGKAVEQEHAATEHKEHGGTNAPSADAIRAAIKEHVMDKSKAAGTFDVLDPETGKTRKLELARIHDRVGKTGDYYYSCADFKDTETGETLDLDLDVQDKGGALSVVDVRIHKVGGKERYTYDEKDNRIPLNAEGGPMKSGAMEGSH